MREHLRPPIFVVPLTGLEPVWYLYRGILRQSAHETRIFTKVKNPIKQGVFALKQGKKCPKSDHFRLYRSFRDLLSSHFFPKLFTRKTGGIFRCRSFLFAHFLNKSYSDAITSIRSNSRFYPNRPLQGSPWL